MDGVRPDHVSLLQSPTCQRREPVLTMSPYCLIWTEGCQIYTGVHLIHHLSSPTSEWSTNLIKYIDCSVRKCTLQSTARLDRHKTLRTRTTMHTGHQFGISAGIMKDWYALLTSSYHFKMLGWFIDVVTVSWSAKYQQWHQRGITQ